MIRAYLVGSVMAGIVVMFTLSTISPIFAQNDEYEETQKFLTGVGSEYDENNLGFDIEYYLQGDLSDLVIVNSTSKSITFEYDSKGIPEEDLMILLPVELIEPPITVYVNGEEELESIHMKVENITQITIPVHEDSKEITLVGGKVIPEFGSFAILILVLSIISIIGLTSKKNFHLP